jgi:plasmid maintenance system antidote protein VapI
MLFADLMDSLIAVLRARVRNGEITERGLARMVDISQPHMHNVLKGTRSLSPELSDRVLRHLRLSVLDLIEKERFAIA